MLELIDDHLEETILANGNRTKMIHPITADLSFMGSPEARKRVSALKEESAREKMFADMVLHILDKIEKESRDEFMIEDYAYPEPCLLDMKKYLKEGTSISGVSENSPIFVVEGVSAKLGHILQNFNIYELSQLADCTQAEAKNIAQQSHHVSQLEIECAISDARAIVNILANTTTTPMKRGDGAFTWDNITQGASSILQIKQNTKKVANFMGQFMPKNITSPIDVFIGQSAPDGDDEIESFYSM